MKSFIPTLALITSALAASSELLTIRSTTIATLSCSEVVPSSFFFPNSTSIIDTTSSSTKVKSTIYAYETDYENQVQQVTRTVCDENGCYVTTDLESSTTYTTYVNGVLTVVTTCVPVTPTASSTVETSIVEPTTTAIEAASTETDFHTTVITITSCKDHKCEEVEATTGVTVITENDTIYTTYCPLSGETSESKTTVTSESSKVTETTETTKDTIESSTHDETTTTEITQTITIKSSSQEAEKPTTEVASEAASVSVATVVLSQPSTVVITRTASVATTPLSTINVITNNIITETTAPKSVKNSSAAETPSITFTAYEGAAASVATSGFIGVVFAIVLAVI
ncbi:uncharacterized protein RJT20DRAFT_53801 [Scheffersomyces xylosifermentans]|uniref:uncharacterized protein n=1 Tax=Scheffersomyces xylosifermentans TaxID=1304137 RepID=UPI00315D78E9